MRPELLQGFMDELEKLAVSTQQLAAAAERIGYRKATVGRAIRNPRKIGRLLSTRKSPALSLPSAKVMQERASERMWELAGESLKRKQGRIYVRSSKELAKKLAPGQKLGKGDRRAVRDAVVVHEGAERKVPHRLTANDYHDTYGHANPRVLLHEHNMISRLTGPGSEKVRKAFRGMRESTGEMSDLQRSMEKVYGPRVRQFFREGEKVPKAVTKDFAKRVAAGHPVKPKGSDINEIFAQFQRSMRGQ